MIFGLSFSACADTTGGVTATAVAPRAVDSFGNIIDTSENVNHVEYASSTKVTTTETTTTKPAYNQEEMKKDLEDLGKEDMAASTIGIFAWVKGLVDWTQGIINALGAAIKAGINSPWGFDLKGFVDLFAPFFKTIGYGLLVILFGINILHSATTSIIKGFTSQSGKSFDAKLIIKDDNTIGFEFPERLKCPICGKEMVKSSKGWTCTGYKYGCNFFIAGTICGKCITDTIATMLCANKRTRIINGFTSKAGKAFSAALVVKDGKIDFDFPAKSQKRNK
jgi:hypothetical protein